MFPNPSSSSPSPSSSSPSSIPSSSSSSSSSSSPSSSHHPYHGQHANEYSDTDDNDNDHEMDIDDHEGENSSLAPSHSPSHSPKLSAINNNNYNNHNGHHQSSSSSSTSSPSSLPPFSLSYSSSPSSSSFDPLLSLQYIPTGVVPKLSKYLNKIIEIRISSKYLTCKNKEVLTRQLWGGQDNVYTDDSDVVSMVQHTGMFQLRVVPPPENHWMSCLVKVLPARENGYPSIDRNGIRSRSWISSYSRCSLQMIKAEMMSGMAISNNTNTGKGSNTGENGVVGVNGEGNGAAASSSSSSSSSPSSSASSPSSASSSSPPSTSPSTSPTISPLPSPLLSSPSPSIKLMKMLLVEKSPQQKSSAKSKRRYVPDTSIVSNGQNHLVMKYSLDMIGDHSMDEKEWMAMRMRRECCYFETEGRKYEIAKEESKGKGESKEGHMSDISSASSSSSSSSLESVQFDRYRLSQLLSFHDIDVIYDAMKEEKEKERVNNNNITTGSVSGGNNSANKRGRTAAPTPTTPSSTNLPSPSPTSPSLSTSVPSSIPSSSFHLPPSLSLYHVPLHSKFLKVLERDLDWEDMEWGPSSIRIRGKKYQLENIMFKEMV